MAVVDDVQQSVWQAGPGGGGGMRRVGGRLLQSCVLCVVFVVVQMNSSSMSIGVVCDPNSTVGWSDTHRGAMFSAVSLGRLGMLATGSLADRANSKWVVVGSLSAALCANALIPWLNSLRLGVLLVLLCRVLLGLTEALITPSVNVLMTRWMTPKNRAAALAVVTSGRQIGILVVLPVGGLLCQSYVNGWSGIFYLCAVCTAGAICLCLCALADKPSKSCCVSNTERAIIDRALGMERLAAKRSARRVPWSALLRSCVVWTHVLAAVCHELPLMTIMAFMPTYLRDTCHITCGRQGIFSAVPFAALLVSKCAVSLGVSAVRSRLRCSISLIARLSNAIGCVGMAAALLAATYTSCSPQNYTAKVALLAVAVAMSGFHSSGCLSSMVCIAPAYSGTVTGLCFFFVSVFGIAHPLLVTALVSRSADTLAAWNAVLVVSAGIAAVPCVAYSLWGTTEVQSWARDSAAVPRSPDLCAVHSDDISIIKF